MSTTGASPPATGASPAGTGPSAITEPAALLGQAFKAAMAAVRRLRGRETHNARGLTFAQYSLLFSLADGSPRSVRELAFAADLSSATATEMLDHLAAIGLIERARSERDRRVVLTSLTERGRELIERRRAQIEPHWRAALADFSDDELRAAAAVLDGLRRMFDEFPEI